MAAGTYTVEFPDDAVVDGGWNPEGISSVMDALLGRADLDVILAAGVGVLIVDAPSIAIGMRARNEMPHVRAALDALSARLEAAKPAALRRSTHPEPTEEIDA